MDFFSKDRILVWSLKWYTCIVVFFCQKERNSSLNPICGETYYVWLTSLCALINIWWASIWPPLEIANVISESVFCQFLALLVILNFQTKCEMKFFASPNQKCFPYVFFLYYKVMRKKTRLEGLTSEHMTVYVMLEPWCDADTCEFRMIN